MKILIIGPSWVGDMMMSHSLYRTLKHNNMDTKIDVMAPDWSRGLLKMMPQVTGIINMPIDHGKLALFERYKIGKFLKSKQYDSVIILPNSFKSALIPFFAEIPKRTGWLGEMRYGLLNDYRRLDKKALPLMVERYIALAFDANEICGAGDIPKPLLWPELTVSPPEISQTLAACDLPVARRFIGFCAGAEFGPAKCWPAYHYALLANMLAEREYHILLFGSAKDKQVGRDIVERLRDPTCCTNLAGKTTLEQVVTLLAACAAVVTNDSGLMHIAAALNRPLVALYGPSSPDFTPPLSNHAEVIRLISGYIKTRKGDSNAGYHQSLIDIRPEWVFDTVMNLLSRYQKNNNQSVMYE